MGLRADALPPVNLLSRKEIDALLPGAVHQGIAVYVEPLEPPAFSALVPERYPRALFLDHVCDPHNVGAILRNAAAFGVRAVGMTERHCPPLEGVVAKSAAGGLEHVDCWRLSNLVRSLELLKTRGYFCVGFSQHGNHTLAQVPLDIPLCLVVGAEGDGMRRLTKETCDFLVALPTAPHFPSLNVSSACAVALAHFMAG